MYGMKDKRQIQNQSDIYISYSVRLTRQNTNLNLCLPFSMYIMTLADEFIASSKCDITINLSINGVLEQSVLGNSSFGGNDTL